MSYRKVERLTAVQTARLVRRMLRHEYPTTKFSFAKSKSNTNDYEARWLGGPSANRVRDFMTPYITTTWDPDTGREYRRDCFIGYSREGHPLLSGIRTISLYRQATPSEVERAMDLLIRNGYFGDDRKMLGAAMAIISGTSLRSAASFFHLKRDGS